MRIKYFFSFIYWVFIKNNNYSQSNEENILKKTFKNVDKGFFVDVGAHHPFRYSNTALLYKKGWNGISVEADRRNLWMFKYFRKRDINLNYIVSNKTNPVNFYYFKEGALNGILSKNRLKLLKKDGFIPVNKEKLTPITLSEILRLHLPKDRKIDLLTIDVEGHDLEVLQSLDLKKYFVKVILTEVNENKIALNQYLEENGYHLVKKEDRNLFYAKGKL